MEKMAEAIAPEKKLRDDTIDTKHIDVLDGIRALAVLGVLWFHFWQQNWIMPYIDMSGLTVLGLPGTLSLLFLPRAGFLFVDWLLFLSAFCLFLPYARAAIDQTQMPGTRVFYQKRIARIVPSYYFAVFVIFFAVSVPSKSYSDFWHALADLLPTLTFTQTLYPSVLLGTKINGVLWTAAIEMQFYLLFPLLARAFSKKPIWTYLGMFAISVLYLRGYALEHTGSIRLTVNQLPGFFGVFANGMAASFLFVLAGKHLKRSPQLSALALVGLLTGGYLLYRFMNAVPEANIRQIWQADNRYLLSLVFALITCSSALTFSGIRWLLSNRWMQFLSLISYNVYIWHQWIAVKFKDWRIPSWSGETPPNMTGDTRWQWTYTALILLATFALAIATTYFIERPAAKRILAWQPKEHRGPMIWLEVIEPEEGDAEALPDENKTDEGQQHA